MLLARHLVVAALTGVALACVACQQPAADVSESDKEAKKQVVHDVFAALDAKDWDRLAVLIPADSIGHMAGSDETVPQAAILQMIPMFYAAFPDYHHVIHELVAEGDVVAARMSYQGTQEGEFQGIPATGNAVNYDGMQFFRVVDGAVKEWWLLEDNLTFMSQLGRQLAPVVPESQ